MKSPLHYQISEYDCGPTSMLNAIKFLFEREQISPELIRNIMLYSLDSYSTEGAGKSGTSRIAMMFLSNWINGFGAVGQLPICSEYLTQESVFIGSTSRINDALSRGGVVIPRLYYDVEHYVLLTGSSEKGIHVFDPYFHTDAFPERDILLDQNHPFAYNTIVPQKYFTRTHKELYSLGEMARREAIIIYNTDTFVTPDRTIEYFI